MSEEEAKKELTFEEALERLEYLVGQLESGRIPLEESMKAFEEGVKLQKFCAEKLGAAQQKIELLMKNTSGEWEWKEQPIADNQ